MTQRIFTLGDEGLLKLRENEDNGDNEITLQSPATLAADYTLTLPTGLPTATKYVTMSATGVLSTTTIPTVDVVAESAAVIMDGTLSANPTNIAHGLSYTPVASQITLTCYRSSGSNDFGIRGLWIMSIDATNIQVMLYVTATAATTYAKIVARIHPA